MKVSNNNKKDQILDYFSESIIMVKPLNFGTNIETLEDNSFMIVNSKSLDQENTQSKVLKEFNDFQSKLDNIGIKTKVFDQEYKEASDSVFPNNWFSTHPDTVVKGGLAIIYPMKSKLRRLERTKDIIDYIKKCSNDFLDLSYLELENEYLESTGCLIFNNQDRVIYCSISERATEKAVDLFLSEFNKKAITPFELIKFKSYDKNGKVIYHTNCIMSVLKEFILICSEVVCFCDRKKFDSCIDKNDCRNRLFGLIQSSNKSNKEIIDITFEEMSSFACNCINLRNSGKSVIVMSQRAYNSLRKEVIDKLLENNTIVYSDLKTIEDIGGGSARCMIAECF